MIGCSAGQTEDRRNLGFAHAVEVARNRELAGQKAEALRFGGGVEGRDFRNGLAGAGDDDRLAGSRLLDEAREVRLGFVDVHGGHTLNLVQWT